MYNDSWSQEIKEGEGRIIHKKIIIITTITVAYIFNDNLVFYCTLTRNTLFFFENSYCTSVYTSDGLNANKWGASGILATCQRYSAETKIVFPQRR